MKSEHSSQIGSDEIDRLFAAAAAVRERAHAPYSRFAVGAALLADTGAVVAGCNVENAAYPLGLCAEAAAIGAMVADGGQRIRAIAILGGRVGEAAGSVMPCGGCRQRIAEFADAGTLVLTLDRTGRPQQFIFPDLLPHAFEASALGRKA